MNTRTTLSILVLVGMLILVYLLFRSYPGQDALEQSLNMPSPQQSEPMSPQYGPLDETQKSIADRAIGKLLNTVSGLDPSMIAVNSFEEREYSNSSLGCPQPGMNYAEVITPGYRVILTAQDVSYDYRLDENEAVLLCPDQKERENTP